MAQVASGNDHWWQNWPKTHAYVAGEMFFPTNVDELAAAVTAAEMAQTAMRAVGGGWSFTDASLPDSVTTNRPDYNGADAIARLLPLAEGFPADDQASISSINQNDPTLFGYDSNNNRSVGGAQDSVLPLESQLNPPQPQPVILINTRSLKSALPLNDILSRTAKKATASGTDKFYFHVEAGIRMDELAALLDAQSPRLQLGASGGNPGATLAGTLSTATHGAEFNMPLLVDRVRAVHLVGPGGQQWWIEGNTPIVDKNKLAVKYPGIRIVAGTTHVNGLLPQDWLNAVVVSMGCIGVIYSVVLDVPALSGSQQVTSQGSWLSFLARVGGAVPGSLTSQQMLSVLRNPASPQFAAVNATIAQALQGAPPFVGVFNDKLIGEGQNFYADLAFNPNPVATTNASRAIPGDRDIWIVNRRAVPVPFDMQPPNSPGLTSSVNAVFIQLKKAFGGNVLNLVTRLQEVYGLVDPLHIDVPLPHADIPPLHVDAAGRIDIEPHIDIREILNITPHIDTPAAHVDVQSHVDTPGAHVDAAFHVDIGPHVDISAGPLHGDLAAHGDIGPHVDVSPHVDAGPHVDIAPHFDVAQHVDIAPHADVAQHVDVAPHVDVASPHIDLSPAAISFTLEGLLLGVTNPLLNILKSLFGLLGTDVADVLESLILLPFDLAGLVAIITKIANASDTLDVALGEITGPIAAAGAIDIAQPALTGFLASLLGTATSNPGLSTGTSVGAIGFPDSGLVGAGIEIALPAEAAFGFLQVNILDQLDAAAQPFFGYVSVRMCPQTSTLLGMQQWPTSVMIEAVAFGDDFGKSFISQLQQKALAFIANGNDAMLHWGLENDQMTSVHLGAIPALQRPTVSNAAISQLQAFKMVRQLIYANNSNNPPGLFRAFDNAFTTRLNLM